MKAETKNRGTVGAWTAVAIVMALVFMGPDREANISDTSISLTSTAHAQQPKTTKPAEKPKPTKTISNCDDDLARERSTWDENRGNNFDAAQVANGLRIIYEAVGFTGDDIAFSLLLTAPKKAEAKFKRGCDREKYRLAVDEAHLIVGINSLIWVFLDEDTMRDLVTGWWKAIDLLYSNAAITVSVIDENMTICASATSTIYDARPDIDLE